MSKPHSFSVNNEQGSATTISMIVSFTLVLSYILIGHSFLSEQVPPTVHGILAILLGLFTIFSLGCGMHMLCVGCRSNKQIRRDLRAQLIELGSFIDFTDEKISSLDDKVRFHSGAIRPIGRECLGHSKRILEALVERIREVNSLINSKNALDLIEADELIQQDLILNSNTLNSLIGTEPLPPISTEEWIPTVNRLLDKVEIELDKAVQKIAA